MPRSPNSYSASHLTYLLLCPRKLWLHHAGMRLEDNSAAVRTGKYLGERSYQRRPARWRELDLGGAKVDHFDARLRLVREVKKSDKLEHVHVAQVRYYLWLLERRGVDGAAGVIEYPQQRRRTEVPPLTEDDRQQIRTWLADIDVLVRQPTCPPAERKPYCRRCAFHDFCFV